jgi:membrane protein implicated in regulation of membrane protease activity
MPLRNLVVSVLAVGAILALALAFTHCAAPWLIFAIYAVIGIILILIERGRYQPKLTGSQFEPTNEYFADPVSGHKIRVYVDCKTGERDYRREE